MDWSRSRQVEGDNTVHPPQQTCELSLNNWALRDQVQKGERARTLHGETLLCQWLDILVVNALQAHYCRSRGWPARVSFLALQKMSIMDPGSFFSEYGRIQPSLLVDEDNWTCMSFLILELTDAGSEYIILCRIETFCCFNFQPRHEWGWGWLLLTF